MLIRILKTNGRKIFSFERFENGFWFVFNFIPKRFGVYFEISF